MKKSILTLLVIFFSCFVFGMGEKEHTDDPNFESGIKEASPEQVEASSLDTKATTTDQVNVSIEDPPVVPFTGTKRLQVEVNGMTCQGCEKKISDALSKMDGVISTDVSYSSSTVICHFDSQKLNMDDIKSEINKAGFKAGTHAVLNLE